MPPSAVQTFDDPDQVAASLRSGAGTYKVLGRGPFRAETVVVGLERVTLQCASESLARVAYHAMQPGKVGVLAWTREPLPVVRGVELRPGEIMSLGRDMAAYHQTKASVDFAAVLTDADELERVAIELTDGALSLESGVPLRPPADALARLLALCERARSAARRGPHVFAGDEAGRALEQELLYALVACLPQATFRREPTLHRRAQIMARFEAVVEANTDRPLHVPELCRLVGVPERTLRKCCQLHLGMSPHQYLLRRRIQLARRALLGGDGMAATVTSVATRHGFWELGRFAASYRSAFGEAPSATLRRAQAEFA